MTTSPGWAPIPAWPSAAPGYGPTFVDAPVRVWLDEFEFWTVHGYDNHRSPGGFAFGLHDWEGWEEPAPDATAVSAHPSGDGQVAGIELSGPRPISLSGLLKCSTDSGPGSISDVLTRLGSKRRRVMRVAEKHGFEREADVRISRLQSTRVAPRLARYTISLVADDPLRYSTATQSLVAGAQVLVNAGDKQAFPVIDLHGASTLTINHPGGAFSVTVPSGAHMIDCRNGDVWRPNGRRMISGFSGAWPRVEPGGSEWTVGISGGSARVRRFGAWR